LLKFLVYPVLPHVWAGMFLLWHVLVVIAVTKAGAQRVASVTVLGLRITAAKALFCEGLTMTMTTRRALLMMLALTWPFPAACAVATRPSTTASQSVLHNGGFEDFDAAAGLPIGWRKAVYGAVPAISIDADVRVEGKRSLRITSSEPSDTAIAHDVKVTPGAAYRFSGFVRTRDLLPDDASWAYGTIQIQDGLGRPIARARNHGGTTEWTRESLSFRAPADGKLHIACFFVGFGKGTGSVWFDDLRLEPIPDDSNVLVVTAARLQRQPISPLIYGNFIELLSDLAPSMWAEMLDCTSFEYLWTPQDRKVRESKFVHDPMRDPKDRLWRPLGDPIFAKVTLDPDQPFNGTVSQRIELKAGGSEAGIWQDDLAVTAGGEYLFVGHFRCGDFAGPVVVELRDGDAVLASGSITNVANQWQRKELVLRAGASADHARFALRIASSGTVWVDRVSLMPVKNTGGWRPDVIEMIRAMRPGLIRWGGSVIETYDWKKMIGPWEQRVPFPNAAWGRIDPNLVGIDEFVALCRAVGAEPLICVRWTGQRPSDAAELVQYCNGSAQSPMGAVRAANGHRQPYGVRYFQIGNEVGGPKYEASLADFAKAMKETDASVRLLACYISPAILKNAGGLIDFVSPHPYDIGNLQATAAQLDRYGEMLQRLAPGRDIKIAATEWNTTAGDWGNPQRTRQMSLGNSLACARYLHLAQRRSDLVTIACRSNMSNSYCSGIIQTNNRAVMGTPAYQVLKLYAERGHGWPLVLGENADVLPIDASAAISEDDKTVTLMVVNPQREPVEQEIDVSAFARVEAQVEVWTVADAADAHDPDVMNTFDRPNRIDIVLGRFKGAGKRFRYPFPALSITALQLRVDPHR
jgi:alpha-N-arabinofuranosidase